LTISCNELESEFGFIFEFGAIQEEGVLMQLVKARVRALIAVLAGALMLAGLVVAATPAAGQETNPDDPLRPIVFVHGGSGSASQYMTAALRFTSNGFPLERIRAFEYGATPSSALDGFIDDVRAEFGVDQVNVAAHSLGTLVMAGYLGNPGQAAKVANYAAIDGLPSCAAGVDCILISAAAHGQTHVEVVSSPESFARQYELFFGVPPATTMVLPEPPGEVNVAGRAINFPANSGLDGATVEIWGIHAGTGARKGASPDHTLAIGPDGNFGPVPMNGQQHYEFNVIRDDGHQFHFWFQPIVRSTNFVRLGVSPPDSAIAQAAHNSENHTNAVIVRQREWWTSVSPDLLTIETRSPGRGDQPPVDVLTNVTGNSTVGIHVQDAEATPNESTLNLIPAYDALIFQTGVDVFMPATDPADGVISFVNAPRGDTSRTQVINIPNRPSSGHANIVNFRDYVQDINTWGECKRAKPSPC
jgi:pimeloyl-ACP methyl ester carboxylesterase